MTKEMDKEFLDLAVTEAIERIHKAYNLTNGEIYLSFSGGKDSTVLAELVKMAKLPTDIPFVFANTGLEFDAIQEFVKEYDYPNIVIVKPRKPMGKIIKEYGKPAISKMKSELLYRYQKQLRQGKEPMDLATVRQLITAKAEKNGVLTGKPTQVALAQKHYHLLHEDLEYKIANKCCEYMKKKPFVDFEKENNMKGAIAGIRVAEGGVRFMTYKSCTMTKKKHGIDFTFSTPIYDWSDELMEMFIEEYDVKLSKAYTEYGCIRTGCVGCPFANQNVVNELEIVKKYEPNRYKASMFWFKDVYADMGIDLPFDENYVEYKKERDILNQERRLEMMKRYQHVRSFKELRDMEKEKN